MTTIIIVASVIFAIAVVAMIVGIVSASKRKKSKVRAENARRSLKDGARAKTSVPAAKDVGLQRASSLIVSSKSASTEDENSADKPSADVAAAKVCAPSVERDEAQTPVDDDDGEEPVDIMPVDEGGKTRLIIVRYSKSFTAKLIQSDDIVKRYYSDIKNELCSYGAKSRIGWRWESFRVGNKTVAKMRIRGKTLSVAFALGPEEFAHTSFAVEDLSEVKAYAKTPCLYKIKTDRRCAKAKTLVEKVMAALGANKHADADAVDYAAMYPYEETDALITRKLIKVLDDGARRAATVGPSEVRRKVSAQEVDSLMRDEVAASLIERSSEKSDASKKGIINIDTLAQYFDDGDVVTLKEIKKRVKSFNGNATYIKVLARGVLDKRLTVEADSFSLQAVKMIVLTGGTAIKK